MVSWIFQGEAVMKRFFASLFLFLFSGATWAADFTNNTAMNNHHDLSMTYLGQVFGTVGNVLQSSSGQMLGQLFYRLNEGIIVVAGLWLVYTVFTIVVRSAQEGSFMGANKNVALTFLKIAVGFSFLIPNPSTGYSLLQDLVMKVVVEGVGLADQTWEYSLEYIRNGGTVWHSPSDSGGGGRIIKSQTIQNVIGGVSDDKKGPGQQIFASEVCMYSSIDNQNNLPATGSPTSTAVTNPPPVQYDVVTNDRQNRYEFPGLGDQAPIGPGSNKCGSVSWDIQNACLGKGGITTAQCIMAKQALGELVDGLLPAAKEYYCSQHPGANSCTGIYGSSERQDNPQTFFTALVNYVNVIVPLVQLNSGNAENAKQFINEAENEGWLSAGRYYWDLSQVQAHYGSISNIENYIPNDPIGPSVSPQSQPFQDATNALQESYLYMPAVATIVSQYADAQNSGDPGNAAPNWSGGSIGNNKFLSMVTSVLAGPIGDIFNLIWQFQTGPGGTIGNDPIVFLHTIGMSCIGIAADIWFGSLGLIVAGLVLLGFCNSEVDMIPAVQSTVDWIKPLLMALAGGFWVIGFILGFFVPMYPYLIFTFGIIGWIIAVIEAMVAAPLICFGLTHPDGHDFLGEAKQAAMLLLGIFLRPTLMVIGLIAAMILSYVSLRIVVYTFSGFISDLFYWTGTSVGPADGSILVGALGLTTRTIGDLAAQSGLNALKVGFLVFPLILVIFTALVYVITTQCFSLIFLLPDNILRWIGSPQQSSMAGQLAQQVQSITTSAGNMTAQGLQGMSQEQSKKEQEQRGSEITRKSDSSSSKTKSSGGKSGGAPGGQPPA